MTISLNQKLDTLTSEVTLLEDYAEAVEKGNDDEANVMGDVIAADEDIIMLIDN